MDEVEDSGGIQRRRNLWGLSGMYLQCRYRTTVIACCGSGSGIRCCLDPPGSGSGIRVFQISDPRSLIHISASLITIFGVKILFSLSIDSNFSVPVKKRFQFCEIHGYKKGKTLNFSPAPLFHCCIRDPRSGIRHGNKSGSGINMYRVRTIN
jgi:hypothetical protein